MQSLKEDDFYIETWGRFISKFICISEWMKRSGIDIFTSPRGLCRTNHNILSKKQKISGVRVPHRHWHIMSGYTGTNPVSYIVNGKYATNEDVYVAVEKIYNFIEGTMESAFSQGFYHESSYKDVFKEMHWSVAAGFHIGRYFLDRYCGIKLTYKIPDNLKKFF